ncbi:DEP domain-containing protein 7-like [Aplochiton taeniatus]
MASVRERALALNLAEKLCLRPPGPGLAIKTARASFVWSSIISHLRATVSVKFHRVHFKACGNCFLGADAVDVVKAHLIHNKFFEGADVSRDKVSGVCQALLDCQVFEAVGTHVFGKNKKLGVFQDSKNALYRFGSTFTSSVEELERGVLSNGIQSYFCCAPPNSTQSRQEEWPSTHRIPVMICTPVKGNSLERLVEDLNLSPSTLSANTSLPQSSVEEVLQEQTMLRLLQLVELPLLEDVLEASQNRAPSGMSPARPDLIYNSNDLDRQILRAFGKYHEDLWLSAALDCLDFLPDQLVVEFSRELPGCAHLQAINPLGQARSPAASHSDHVHQPIEGSNEQSSCAGIGQCKLLAYQTLVKYYSQTEQPALLPDHWTSVYTGITDLLVSAKLDKALEALQLCLKLLPSRRREELQRLLYFMSLAADSEEIRLDREVENRIAVKRDFSRVILQTKNLPRDKEDLMMLFMLGNQQDIFKIPGALYKVVSDKLASMVEGRQQDFAGSTFCQKVSTQACADSSQRTTSKELWDLLKNIHENPSFSAKEKKRLLGQFYQGHPEIFLQYFGTSAISVL